MLHIHPNARTTPAVRAEIARSTEPSGTVARHYGISAETARKWRKRGVADCLDRSARPHRLPWKASEEERAVVRALRWATNFPLDDLTFVMCHVLPHFNRDSIWRTLKAEELNRRRPPVSDRPAKGQGTFRDDDLGFIHIDVKHLPKLQTNDGDRRKRYLFVAIDRRSRSVHLAVKDDETEKSAIAFFWKAAAAFPFRPTHVLTDNGSGSHVRLCPCLRRARRGVSPHQAAHAADQRHGRALQRTDRRRGAGRSWPRIRPRSGWNASGGITISSHRDLEQLLRGFNAAHNDRRQRVLDGKALNQVTAQRLKARRRLARGKPEGRAGPDDVARARLVAETAKEVSQPDTHSFSIAAIQGSRHPYTSGHAELQHHQSFLAAMTGQTLSRTCCGTRSAGLPGQPPTMSKKYRQTVAMLDRKASSCTSFLTYGVCFPRDGL